MKQAATISTRVLIATVFMSLTRAEAAPPPPVPPGFPDVVKDTTKFFNERDWPAYLALFTPDVVIIEDGEVRGKGMAALRQVVTRWSGLNWTVRSVASAKGGGNEVLDMEVVTDIPTQADSATVYDCCFWTRAIRYTVGDHHLIREIFILNAKRASYVTQR